MLGTWHSGDILDAMAAQIGGSLEQPNMADYLGNLDRTILIKKCYCYLLFVSRGGHKNLRLDNNWTSVQEHWASNDSNFQTRS
jgi:hypothetical protein